MGTMMVESKPLGSLAVGPRPKSSQVTIAGSRAWFRRKSLGTKPAQNCCASGVGPWEAGANPHRQSASLFMSRWQQVHSPSTQPLLILCSVFKVLCNLGSPGLFHLDLLLHGRVMLERGRRPNPQHQAGVWCSAGTKPFK